MTEQPTITHTHTLDGSHTLPDWLPHDGHHPVLLGRDDATPPRPGWMLVRWSDGHVTVASPQVAARAYGPDGMRGRLERAEAELADRNAAASADAAAGSYASAQANLTITVTAPDPVHAVRWAGHIRDLVHAEHGQSMRLHSFIELEPGGRVEPDSTGPLTGIEVRDPCPWCESSPSLIPRTLMGEHVATVHPEGGPRRWLLQGTRDLDIPNVPRFTYRPVTPEMERAATARAEQAAADSERSAAWFAATGGVLGIPADGTEESSQTTSDNSPTSEDVADNPTATEATEAWKEPVHPRPCTATIEGRATPGGRQVQCTREARHPENHVGPKLGANGRVLWTDHQPGDSPHKEQP